MNNSNETDKSGLQAGDMMLHISGGAEDPINERVEKLKKSNRKAYDAARMEAENEVAEFMPLFRDLVEAELFLDEVVALARAHRDHPEETVKPKEPSLFLRLRDQIWSAPVYQRLHGAGAIPASSEMTPVTESDEVRPADRVAVSVAGEKSAACVVTIDGTEVRVTVPNLEDGKSYGVTALNKDGKKSEYLSTARKGSILLRLNIDRSHNQPEFASNEEFDEEEAKLLNRLFTEKRLLAVVIIEPPTE